LAKSAWAAVARGTTGDSYSPAPTAPSRHTVLERPSLPYAFAYGSCVCVPAYFFYLNMHFVLKDFVNPQID